MTVKDSHRAIRIQLFGKADCCLCDQALRSLESLAGEFPLQIEKIDIATSSELQARYGNDIPVATLDGRELFRHVPDMALLRAAFRRAQAGISGSPPS